MDLHRLHAQLQYNYGLRGAPTLAIGSAAVAKPSPSQHPSETSPSSGTKIMAGPEKAAAIQLRLAQEAKDEPEEVTKRKALAAKARDTRPPGGLALVDQWREVSKPRKQGQIKCQPAGCKLDFPGLFDEWLALRQLSDALKYTGDEQGWRIYRYMREPVVQSDASWERAFHGTWWYSVWVVLYSGVFLESSDRSLGHDFWEPGVYCSPCIDTGLWYARPQILFADGVFHRVIFELRVDPKRRKQNRKRGGVQWVFPSSAVQLYAVWVRVNAPPKNGEERVNGWEPQLEAVPPGTACYPHPVTNPRNTWTWPHMDDPFPFDSGGALYSFGDSSALPSQQLSEVGSSAAGVLQGTMHSPPPPPPPPSTAAASSPMHGDDAGVGDSAEFDEEMAIAALEADMAGIQAAAAAKLQEEERKKNHEEAVRRAKEAAKQKKEENMRKEMLVELYLPKQVNGVSVLESVGEGTFKADNTLLKATTRAIVYRKSKNMADEETVHLGLLWNDSISGSDEADGWIKVVMKQQEFETRLAEFKKDSEAHQNQQKRQKLNAESAQHNTIDLLDDECEKLEKVVEAHRRTEDTARQMDDEEKRQRIRERRQKKLAEQMQQDEAVKRQEMRERRKRSMPTAMQTEVAIVCDD